MHSESINYPGTFIQYFGKKLSNIIGKGVRD